ncbi:hypothetical protein [Melittangium boletus]|uniref:Uncharacterized protein n=1 Tax=Melittangium boletus DSM 14713 TaxID=1294270 RepID=A0A250IKQ2_9BACT|nr:hypothetical protein [Melittangium boletus]ATB31812.1 hypothetical protein MEBOL_005281 [Melittangium boletus DSM 14713]
MNSLIAFSLSLLMGQTPAAPPPTEAEAASALQAAELEELRARMQLMQLQSEARRQEDLARVQALEQQRATEQATAQRDEQLRQQRLVSLERGYQRLRALDQLLVAGQVAIDPTVTAAQQELADALASAEETGDGDASRLIQSALNRMSTLTASVEQRNPEDARYQVHFASDELRAAWRMSLDRSPPALTP